MPAEFSGGDIEIARGDLANILYSRTAAQCEYLFGDSIASLEETADGVDVGFERAAPRAFDLVRCCLHSFHGYQSRQIPSVVYNTNKTKLCS